MGIMGMLATPIACFSVRASERYLPAPPTIVPPGDVMVICTLIGGLIMTDAGGGVGVTVAVGDAMGVICAGGCGWRTRRLERKR